MSSSESVGVDRGKVPGVDTSTLAEAMDALLKDHSGLGIRLKQVPFDWNSGMHRLTGSFHYITFADGVPTVQAFVEYLYDCLIPYCLPKGKIRDALKGVDLAVDFSRVVRLGDDAKGLFIKAKNQLESGGEPGELILYALLEWVLKAPRLVSKMYLKTNNNMPVHGTDGIHLGYDEAKDLLTVYFGESKIYQSFSSAADAAFTSMAELLANAGQISREIEILNNLSDLNSLSPSFQAKIAEYINPYSTSKLTLQKRIVHACLLGFEYAAYNRILALEPDKVAPSFEKQYRKRIGSACRVIERHYGKRLPVTTNLHLFLLPFPSLKEFRAAFYGKLGVVA
ncbi:DUF1837 domain-containing protein [Mesorhizobium sp. LCM 4577]|uniref:HamA C-terminal domain-containing protein n=1 Tax=Mesorhizobium sp. LCM 4577 TaxID=1848288 RepID=UPI0010423414|nr:DUF1837 domain-containing protein [Mesorhizobium sp. LCM 4577]